MAKKLMILMLILLLTTAAYAYKPGDTIQEIFSCVTNENDADPNCATQCFVRFQNNTEDLINDCTELNQGRWLVNYTLPLSLPEGSIQLCFNGSNSNSTDFNVCASENVQRGSGWTLSVVLGSVISMAFFAALAFYYRNRVPIVTIGASFIAYLFLILLVRESGVIVELFVGANSGLVAIFDQVYIILIIIGILAFGGIVLWMIVQGLNLLVNVARGVDGSQK